MIASGRGFVKWQFGGAGQGYFMLQNPVITRRNLPILSIMNRNAPRLGATHAWRALHLKVIAHPGATHAWRASHHCNNG
jgi:hypothetical protein